jgi:hypothetical protein
LSYLQGCGDIVDGKSEPLLKAIAKWKEVDPQTTEIDASTWWYDWDQALKAEEWTEAKNIINSNRGSSLTEIDKKLQASSFLAVAERHLEKTKNMFQGDTFMVEKRRKRVAAILRDYRAQGVQIDSTFIDYLLELCQ